MSHKLLVKDPQGQREVLLVGTMTVGRDPRCDISDADPLLSRRHAEFVVTPEGVLIRDLNSRNGILVNGKKVPQAVLQPGDVVQVSRLAISLLSAQPKIIPAPAEPGDDKTLLVTPVAKTPAAHGSDAATVVGGRPADAPVRPGDGTIRVPRKAPEGARTDAGVDLRAVVGQPPPSPGPAPAPPVSAAVAPSTSTAATVPGLRPDLASAVPAEAAEPETDRTRFSPPPVFIARMASQPAAAPPASAPSVPAPGPQPASPPSGPASAPPPAPATPGPPPPSLGVTPVTATPAAPVPSQATVPTPSPVRPAAVGPAASPGPAPAASRRGWTSALRSQIVGATIGAGGLMAASLWLAPSIAIGLAVGLAIAAAAGLVVSGLVAGSFARRLGELTEEIDVTVIGRKDGVSDPFGHPAGRELADAINELAMRLKGRPR